MDILSDVFSTLSLRSGLYFRALIDGPFAVALPEEQRRIRFHLVCYGRVWVTLPGASEPQELGEGDLIIVPHGASQTLSGQPACDGTVALDHLLAAHPVDEDGVLRYGEGGARVRLLCGFCAFDEAAHHPVLDNLPDCLLLRQAALGSEPWARALLQLMQLEAELVGDGMTGILSRLLEVVLIQATRRLNGGYVGADTGYLAALKDRQLAQALIAIHRQSDRPWTVGQLAKEAGMSRAVFADRFTAMVGEAPIAYLTNWRLLQARRLIRNSTLAIDEIARRCGYASLPSFSRRFKAAYGMGPGAFRRQPRAAE